MYDIAVFAVVLSVVAGGTATIWLLTRHDPASSAFAFGLFLLVITFWAATHLGTLFSARLQWLLLFTQLSYVGVVATPIAWLVFAVRYVDRGEWLSSRRLVLMSVVPVVTLVMVFTAQHHSLFYTTIDVVTVGTHPLLQTTAGPWHIVNVVYSYSLLLAGTGLLFAAALSDSRLYRYQSAILIVCVTVPWLANMSYHLARIPFPWFDSTPIAFIATGIPLAAIVVRTDLTSFLPVAHERVVRSLDDPLLIVSPGDEIIDANEAAQRALDASGPLEGSPVTEVLPSTLLDGQTPDTLADGDRVEIAIDHDGEVRQYLVRQQQVEPGREAISRGTVLTMVDITERKQRERRLEQLSAQTQRKNEQLERMSGVISHDMAAPLSTAEKTLSLLRADLGDPDDSIEQSLRDLETVHDRLRGFADHLPRLARESIDVETTEECDLATVARAAWHTIDTGTLDLTITDTGSLHADRRRLQQVFENIFRNTVQHGTTDGCAQASDPTTPGAIQEQSSASTVRVGTCQRGLFIEDDGPGISLDQRDTVFEYGMSTSDSSGFGLAIVRTIIEAHGWEIELVDRDTDGTRFEITITERPNGR